MKTRLIKFGSATSTMIDPAKAGREVINRAAAHFDDGEIDLAIAFFSHQHNDYIEELIAPVLAHVSPGVLIGCPTPGVIGEGHEIEEGPGICLWIASFGGARVEAFEVGLTETLDGMAMVGFPLGLDEPSGVILLADPTTFPTQALLASLNQDYPGMPVVGGLTGAPTPAGNRLILNNQVISTGAVGVMIGGGVEMQAVVAQGCRPIGQPLAVTAAEGHHLIELAGRPPVERLREAVASLHPSTAGLADHGFQIGIVIDEDRTEPVAGDFLIRDIFKANLDTGTMIVSDSLRVGQIIQFQVRDADTAEEQMALQLSGLPEVTSDAGALLFSCMGRGTNMFGVPDHDASAVEASLGFAPSGMFCLGEIGPVEGRNHLHTHSMSLALFSSRS